MPLFNFQHRFVDPIRRGVKTHTIRAYRKNPCKPGDTMFLYCGLRHPGAYRIIEPPKCTKVQDITLLGDGSIYVDDTKLATDEMEQLARRDGFGDLAEMMKFWDGKFPFGGTISHWPEPCVACAAIFAAAQHYTADMKLETKCEAHRV